MKRSEVPQQGLLTGVRVVVCAISVAAPFAGELLAEMGADVIQVENPNNTDYCHANGYNLPGWMNETQRRNMRNMTLNILDPIGREAFLKLMAETDIIIEASRGGQWKKWGLGDKVLWGINPKMVIAHVSGFGQTGVESYVNRTCYDPIAQAFSGIVYSNGDDKTPFFPISDNVADFYTALFTSNSCLAAYINSQRTGKGESLDIAQYECGLRTLNQYLLQDIMENNPERRSFWIASELVAGTGNYKCKEGSVFIMSTGGALVKRLAIILGLPYGTPEFPDVGYVLYKETEQGKKMEAALMDMCSKHTANEIEQLLNANRIPCSQVITFQDMLTNEQYLARDSLTTTSSARWEDPNHPGQPLQVRVPNIVPKTTNNPLRIWRNGVDFGFDTKDILLDLGYTEEEAQAFFTQGVSAYRKESCQRYKHLKK